MELFVCGGIACRICLPTSSSMRCGMSYYGRAVFLLFKSASFNCKKGGNVMTLDHFVLVGRFSCYYDCNAPKQFHKGGLKRAYLAWLAETSVLVNQFPRRTKFGPRKQLEYGTGIQSNCIARGNNRGICGINEYKRYEMISMFAYC